MKTNKLLLFASLTLFTQITPATEFDVYEMALKGILQECSFTKEEDVEISYAGLEGEFEIAVAWNELDSEVYHATVMVDEDDTKEISDVPDCGQE